MKWFDTTKSDRADRYRTQSGLARLVQINGAISKLNKDIQKLEGVGVAISRIEDYGTHMETNHCFVAGCRDIDNICFTDVQEELRLACLKVLEDKILKLEEEAKEVMRQQLEEELENEN